MIRCPRRQSLRPRVSRPWLDRRTPSSRRLCRRRDLRPRRAAHSCSVKTVRPDLAQHVHDICAEACEHDSSTQCIGGPWCRGSCLSFFRQDGRWSATGRSVDGSWIGRSLAGARDVGTGPEPRPTSLAREDGKGPPAHCTARGSATWPSPSLAASTTSSLPGGVLTTGVLYPFEARGVAPFQGRQGRKHLALQTFNPKCWGLGVDATQKDVTCDAPFG